MFEKKPGAKSVSKRVCFVAYTLNNEQPVISTIIGDQPLFYMDYGYEDPEYLDADTYGDFERELGKLKSEISALDRFSEDFTSESEGHFESFLDNADDFKTPFVYEDTDNALLETLSKSRLGAAYINLALKNGIEIIESMQVRTSEYYAGRKKILINRALPAEEQVLLLARELCRHWQDEKQVLVNPLLFSPDDAIFVNRLQVADVCASVIRVAWELQLAGERGPWERIENSSFADLGRAFAREALFDFRTLANGSATLAVLESWFLSERCLSVDKTIIQSMLSDHQGYMFDMHKAAHKRALDETFVAAFGDMPPGVSGKNYLSGHVGHIMNDSVFTDVRDRANANFLWFIKFERSFREAEQDLQTVPETTAGDDRLSAFHTETQDQDHDGQTADIIHLSDRAGAESRTLDSTKPPSGRHGADIIYLRRWSGD